jgi:hypothetical protein
MAPVSVPLDFAKGETTVNEVQTGSRILKVKLKQGIPKFEILMLGTFITPPSGRTADQLSCNTKNIHKAIICPAPIEQVAQPPLRDIFSDKFEWIENLYEGR